MATSHLTRAFEMDRACPAMVATSMAFAPIRQAGAVKDLLETYGIR